MQRGKKKKMRKMKSSQSFLFFYSRYVKHEKLNDRDLRMHIKRNSSFFFFSYPRLKWWRQLCFTYLSLAEEIQFTLMVNYTKLI